MYGALESKRVRISKKLLRELPSNVSEQVKYLADDFGIKSCDLCTVADGYKVHAREGDRITMIRNQQAQSVEMVSANTLGASGLCHAIGSETIPPVGTWFIRVWYYSKYYMDVVNVVPQRIS